MPAEEIQSIAKETTKKTKNEYLKDFLGILFAVKRTLSYSFKIAPLITAIVIATTVLSSVLPFLGTWINSRLIDEVLNSVKNNLGFSNLLAILIAQSLTVSVTQNFIGRINEYADLEQYYKFSFRIGKNMDEKFANLDTEYYEDPEINNLLQKVREKQIGGPLNFITGLFDLIRILFTIASSTVILIFFSPLLILIVTVTTVPALINNVVFGKRVWGIWDTKGDVRRDYYRSRWPLSDEKPLQEIRIFNIKNYLLDRAYNLFSDFQSTQRVIEIKRIKIKGVLDVVRNLGSILTIIILVSKALSRFITIGYFNFYLSSARMLQGGFTDLFDRLSRIYEDGLYMVDLYTFMDLKEKVVNGTEIISHSEAPLLIEFKNISFKYPGTDKNVLENFNLRIEPREKIAIVGENGAGKSTLIKLLMRFYDVNNGEIIVGGKDIKVVDREDWYKNVGVLFQEFNRYHFDAKTNIGVGNVEFKDNQELIKRAAMESGADEFIEKYKNKYDQILDRAFDYGIDPSIGQWQRIALARVFFKDAPILILDEPTSAIDPKAEYEIFQRLFEFTKDKTVIIISHRFSTVRNATRILVMDDGKIIEEGSHEKLVNIIGGKYKIAFELQKKGYE